MASTAAAAVRAQSYPRPERLVEEEVAGFLEAGERSQLGGLALDVAMAGLPVDGPRAVGRQHGIGSHRGRSISRRPRTSPPGGAAPGHGPASIPSCRRRSPHPRRRRPRSGRRRRRSPAPGRSPVPLHRGGHRVEHLGVFGIGIVVREGPVEIALDFDHLRPHPAQRLGREGAGRPVAARADHAQRPVQGAAGGGVGDVTFGHALDVRQGAAWPGWRGRPRAPVPSAVRSRQDRR